MVKGSKRTTGAKHGRNGGRIGGAARLRKRSKGLARARVIGKVPKAKKRAGKATQSQSPSLATKQVTAEIPDRVGRSVGPPAPFTPPKRQFHAPQAPILRENPMKISHFMPFFAQKSPAARLA